MERNIDLVPAVETDGKAITELMIVVYESERSQWFQGHEDDLFIPGYNLESMQKYHMWDHKYFKILYDSILVGVILIFTTGREHGRIERFYILPEHQNLGIGSQVLVKIEDLFPTINLWTLETTQYSVRNQRFYEKNGYKLSGGDEKKRYYYKVIDSSKMKYKDYHVCFDYTGHNFRNCNLGRTDWCDYNIAYSTFSNCNYLGSIFQNANLSHTRFTNVLFRNGVLGDFRMEKEEICNGLLLDTYLHNLNHNTNLDTKITIENCIFKNSKIMNSDLSSIKIEDCILDGGTIDGISISDLLDCYKKVHNNGI